jgi:8-oxo-dGTP pyrophosphatase MutT (NUDIX family)
MIRAQCIVHRGKKILMVKLHVNDDEWWCLPGGRIEPEETSTEAALRELYEECHVKGKIMSQTSQVKEGSGRETITFLVEIGEQEPQLGRDPQFSDDDQILVDMRWLTLAEITERDRAYLWAAGLISIPDFLEEVTSWGDKLSYPG